MFRTIGDFAMLWEIHSQGTLRLFEALSEESLTQSVTEGHRSLAQIAWHIVVSIPELANRAGLLVRGVTAGDPVPDSLEKIIGGYKSVSESLLTEVRGKWSDDSLGEIDNMFGERWPRGLTLKVLMDHEIHHRGQMTVLMRQAGLNIPGVIGPSKEEWAQYGSDLSSFKIMGL
jgi:uncharacterized damage-inducible protein DinB